MKDLSYHIFTFLLPYMKRYLFFLSLSLMKIVLRGTSSLVRETSLRPRRRGRRGESGMEGGSQSEWQFGQQKQESCVVTRMSRIMEESGVLCTLMLSESSVVMFVLKARNCNWYRAGTRVSATLSVRFPSSAPRMQDCLWRHFPSLEGYVPWMTCLSVVRC